MMISLTKRVPIIRTKLGRITSIIIPLIFCCCLVGLLSLSACTTQTPSRFEQAQQESIKAKPDQTAVSLDTVKGGSLNQFFPVSANGYERVFTQEKDGFVQAKLKRNGEELAILTIADTISNPNAKSDFVDAADTIEGFPVVEKGANTTAMLVGDRYQIKVTSRSDDFTPAQRQEWLGKFDLNKLVQLN